MDNINSMIAAIIHAEKNKQSCPQCGAPIAELGGSNGEIIFGHTCDCLMMLVMQRDFDPDLIELQLPPEEFQPELKEPTFDIESGLNFQANKIYTSHCHNCGKGDGVDSRLPKCTEDPPYRYRCKYCCHSLRTHEKFGEGKQFDWAQRGKKWDFNPDGVPTVTLKS